MTAAHLMRASQLMQLGRHEAAEKELRQALLADPNLAHAHALLAVCLLERKAFDEAQHEAQAAVGAEPDNPFVHYVLGRVWYARQYLDRAAAAADEAIRLAPDDADYHAFRGALYFEGSHWAEALREAETGLQFNAEHAQCNNLRAMALVKLGRRAEAGATIDTLLANEPENANAHANKGWTLLEARKPREAVTHFREALRLEPTNEWARVGIIEALKARNPIYGLFLRYLLWMTKLSPRAQWGVLIGGFIGNRLLRGAVKQNPELAPFLTPIIVSYLVFVLFTWLAQPFFNLLLRFHPLGRHALSTEERREADLIGGCLAAAGLCFGLSFLAADDESPLHGLPVTALFAAGLCFPIHVVFACSPGWPRRTMLAVATSMALFTLVWTAAFMLRRYDVSDAVMPLYLFALIGTVWGGQWLASIRPKR